MPSSCTRSVATLLAFTIAIIARPAAQQESRLSAPPTFRGDINFVRVDAIVTDSDDRPVTDLKEADFEVREDGKTQKIEQFKFVRIERTTDKDPKPIRDRHDEEVEAASDDVRLFAIYLGPSIKQREAERARESLIAFVRTQLYPTDMVAIVEQQTLGAISFTRDREELVSRLRLPQPAILENSASRSGAVDRSPVSGRPIRGTRALEELAMRLATLRDARKSIIYVGDSIGSPGGDLTLDFYELITTLNRTNTAVYVIDTGGLTPTSNFRRTINMRALAEQTGGLAIVNTNNFGANLVTVAQDATQYYLLGYTSSAPNDGKFHPIDVRVRRRGVNVRSRSGYLGFTPDAKASPFPRPPEIPSPVKRALAAIGRSVNNVHHVETWVGTSSADGGRSRVTFVWDVSSAAGSSVTQARHVSIVAVDSANITIFSSPEPDTSLPLETGVTKGVSFFSAPGQLRLSVTVLGGDGTVLDSETKTVEVPDFTVPQKSLGVPRVFRARSARDVRLISSDPAVMPVATRMFSRTDRLLIRVDRLEPNRQMKAALLNKLGQVMMELAVTPAEIEAADQIDLRLNSFPPGEYLVEISATQNGTDTKALVPFRVRG